MYDIETGLYYYKSRYYNPMLGRFIQPDTVIPNPESLQDFNRYSYVRNNPLKYIDPSGHFWLTDFFSAIGDFFVQAFTAIAAVLFVAALWVGVVLSGGNPYVLSAAIGGTVGLIQGGISAVINGGDIGLGMLVGAGVGAATAVAAYATFGVADKFVLGLQGFSSTSAFVPVSAKMIAGFVAGIPAGAISGAGSGAIQSFGGGKGSLSDVGRGALNGSILGAAAGGALGGFIPAVPTQISDVLTKFGFDGLAPVVNFVQDFRHLLTIGATIGFNTAANFGLVQDISGSTTGKIGGVDESPTDFRDEAEKQRARRREGLFGSLNVSPITP